MDNTSDICRLCMLNGGKGMESIFCKTNTSCIADTIASVTQLTLFEGDGLPVAVCQKCLFHLDMANTFIQRCTSSDKYLRSLHLGGVEVHPVSETPQKPSISSNSASTGGVEIVPIRKLGGPFANKKFTIKKEVLDESEEARNSRMTFIIGDDYEDDNITIKMEGLSNAIPESMEDDLESVSGSESSSDPAEDDDDEDYKPVLRYQRVKLQASIPAYDITTRSIQLVTEKSDQMEFKCHLCPQKFYNKEEWKKHLANYSEKHSYKCEPSDAMNVSHLAAKNKADSSTKKVCRFKCSDPQCGKKFPGKRALSQHERSRHSTEGKHRCTQCDRSFNQLILYRNHALIHQ